MIKTQIQNKHSQNALSAQLHNISTEISYALDQPTQTYAHICTPPPSVGPYACFVMVLAG